MFATRYISASLTEASETFFTNSRTVVAIIIAIDAGLTVFSIQDKDGTTLSNHATIPGNLTFIINTPFLAQNGLRFDVSNGTATITAFTRSTG